MTITEAHDQLERIIDTFGVASLTAQLSDIAYEKAEHIRANWQDEPLAKAWERLAVTLNTSHLKVKRVAQGL